MRSGSFIKLTVKEQFAKSIGTHKINPTDLTDFDNRFADMNKIMEKTTHI